MGQYRARGTICHQRYPASLALPSYSEHFCTLDSGESSWSCEICTFGPCEFLPKNGTSMKLHGLYCLPIVQCVRCCGTAWHWSLIHMVIHTPCTPFVDTEREGANVLPLCRPLLRGTSCGLRRKPCVEATFRCRPLSSYHGLSRSVPMI